MYFKYICCICNLNCILNTFGMYLYFEFCTFKIVSQNTLQKVNLMRPRIDIAGVIRPGGAIIADYFSVRALSCTTTTRPVQRKVTMSHKVQSTLDCTKRFSAVDIVT